MKENFKNMNIELLEEVAKFEQKHGKDFNFINEKASIMHSMKVKGELFKHIDLDQEFENCDLLDLLGYERIISCKKNNK